MKTTLEIVRDYVSGIINGENIDLEKYVEEEFKGMNLKKIKEYLDENNMYFGYRDRNREDFMIRLYGSCKRQLDYRIAGTIDNGESKVDFYKKLYDENFKGVDLTKKKEIKEEPKEYLKVSTNNNRYPENIMVTLREEEGLNDCDFSKDEELSNLSANEVFEKVMAWEDMWEELPYIKNWIKDIYKVDLDNIK